MSIPIPNIIPIRKLAEILNVPAAKILSLLFDYGVKATINESIDYETTEIIGEELGIKIIPEKTESSSIEVKESKNKSESKKMEPRPPVVTIMGHVDHGKTAILDKIREANVVAGESGGITQHIGAYQIEIPDKAKKESRKITFLDTPGHKAFSAMRSHGANITDIVILVVAAEDGVKPQTIEAVSHARAAKVPIIVAVNKIDKPQADIEMVKKQIADLGLLPEEWGGKTIIAPVSAKTGEGIENLLEMILLSAEMLELKADTKAKASGVVIESRLHPHIGPIATILVQQGILREGESIIIGGTYGKIRTMEDHNKKRVKSASPGTPIQISGLKKVPDFGERFQAMKSEKEARAILEAAEKEKTVRRLIKRIDSTDLKKGDSLRLILKADVRGSLEAIRTSLGELGSDEIKVEIILEGTGSISESDIKRAAAGKATVIGFHVLASPQIRKLADQQGVKIAIYNIIYDLIDDIHKLLSDLLQPEEIKISLGEAEALAIFKSAKDSGIAGLKITKGKIEPQSVALVKRAEKELGTIKIKTLKINQRDVNSAEKGLECGVGYVGNIRLKRGDILEIYRMEEKKKELKK